MCSLTTARDAVRAARKAVLQAAHEHDWPYGLYDANTLMIDVEAQVDGEISKLLPERPIYEKRP
jgi:hypothetical protein